MSNDKLTDPYHHLTFAIGSGDDFVCFDYADMPDGRIRLHAVLNSETGSFIQDFETPAEVPATEAADYARGLVDAAMDWCGENEVEHDIEGWNQDADYFYRAVKAHVKGERSPERKVT